MSTPQEPAPSPSPAPSVVTPPAPAQTPPSRKPLDQYKVLLHNDDHNEMMFVVRSIVEVVRVPMPRAVMAMMEAHKSGVALVAVTHLEHAELLRDQFQSKGLTATIEKA